MKIFFKKLFFLFCFVNGFSQEAPNFSAIDSLYREDQFYFGISYNILQNEPPGVSQNSFSTGINIGFLRDFPINRSRTIAIAPGLGFSYSNYKQNLIIQKKEGLIDYSVANFDMPFDNNKLAMYFIDVPIELRWRTSTFESHKFWRFYTGIKFSYLLNSRSRFTSINSNFIVDNNKDINKLQYGVYLSSGWNSWNAYVYYGLNPIFDKAQISSKPIEINSLNIGIIFYIL
jgi:hypothetical protein